MLCCCLPPRPIHCSPAVQLHVDRMFQEVHEEMTARDLRVAHAKNLLVDAYYFRWVTVASPPASHAAAGCCSPRSAAHSQPTLPTLPAAPTPPHLTTPTCTTLPRHSATAPLCSPCSHPEDVWAILSKGDVTFAKSARMTATREWLGDGVFTQLDPDRHAHSATCLSTPVCMPCTRTRWQTACGQRCPAAPW